MCILWAALRFWTALHEHGPRCGDIDSLLSGDR